MASGKLFNDYLAAQSGAIRQVNLNDAFERRKSISTYYMNCATDLRTGALVIWHALRGGKLTPEEIGLGAGWSFGASLHPPFNLLAGLSIELALKAIAKILDRPDQQHHRLSELCNNVGLQMTTDHIVILDVLTEEIYWSSRYPVPKDIEKWTKATELRSRQWRTVSGESRFKVLTGDPARSINLENYDAIWTHISSAYWRAKQEIIEN